MSGSGLRPRVSVVIATRGRGDAVVCAVTSVLGLEDPDVELCVVDQSDGEDTALALHRFACDPRFALIRVAVPHGLGAARNIGAAHTSAPIVAFTDDDCEVDASWLNAIRERFADPGIAMLFGTVRAAPYDRSDGLIPAYLVRRLTVARGVQTKARVEGIGACMAIRRTALQALGGFDEWLGAGAPLRAAEDTDFAVRALANGLAVCEDPAVAVTHYGFRSWAQRDALVEGYMTGLGAVNAKMLRLGGPAAIQPLWELATRFLFGRPVVDLNGVAPRMLRLRAFLRGAWLGLRLRLDPATGRFVGGDAQAAPARPAAEMSVAGR